jgi:integrase
VRIIVEMLGRSAELWPARWTALRGPTSQLHHSQRENITGKTLANHLANFRAAIAWFAREAQLPKRGVRLDDEWESLRTSITSYRARAILSGFMRHCSAKGVSPVAVSETDLHAFMAYRAASTNLKSGDAARRRIARTWNACMDRIGGSSMPRLAIPPVKSNNAPSFEEFPPGLQRDIQSLLAGLAKTRKGPNGQRRPPCSRSTVHVRRAKLIALIRKAVSLGTPLESLSSLADLLAPQLVERCLDAYWQESGPIPSVYTMDLAALLVFIARQTNCIDADAISCLQDMRFKLERHRSPGLTEKNRALVRLILSPGIWSKVRGQPEKLMQQARELRSTSPVKAAVLAQMAVAIAILIVAPVRLANLGAIRLETNLLRPAGPHLPYFLVFPDHDVKNRVRLEFPLDQELSALIDEYVHNDLHLLRRGSNDLFLFPGFCRGHKGTGTLSAQLTKCILRATGLRVTVHQFRHVAAAIILHARPGDYEFARRLLGHRNIKTTINFYTGLETAQASRIFAGMVRNHLQFNPLGV